MASARAPPPTPAVNAPAAYDPGSNRAIYFGGGFIPRSNATFVLTNANGLGGPSQWIELQPEGGLPPVRGGHSTVYDPVSNRLIVYGGYAGSGDNFLPVNDVWVLAHANGLGGTPNWIQLITQGPAPPWRSAHSAVFDVASNRMIVYGGNPLGTNFNDVWVLVNANGLGSKAEWVELDAGAVRPSIRHAHSAVYSPEHNRMIVFGGNRTGAGRVNDSWILHEANGIGDPPSWEQLATVGTPPPGHYGHVACFDDHSNRMTIALGAGAGSYVNDVWTLTNASGAAAPEPSTWNVEAVSGTPPLPRQSDRANICDPGNNRMTIFGGQGAVTYTDVWVLTASNGLPSTTLRIEQVTPNRGGNAGQVTVRVLGSGFQQGSAVELSDPVLGSVPLEAVDRDGSSVLAARFDLRGKSPGFYRLSVRNANGESVLAPSPFEIVQGGHPELHVVRAVGPFVRGRIGTTIISVTNTGTVDADSVQVVDVIDPEVGRLTNVSPEGIWSKDDLSDASVAARELSRVPALGSAIDSYRVEVSQSAPVNQATTLVRGGAGQHTFLDYLECSATIATAFLECAVCLPACNLTRQVCRPPFSSIGVAACLASGPPCLTCMYNVTQFGHDGCGPAIYRAVDCFCDLGRCSEVIETILASEDPNELTGPAGVGPPRWLLPDAGLPYAIFFENLPEATAPAQEVHLTNTLDPTRFDLSTFFLGPIVVADRILTPPPGKSSFSGQIDLRDTEGVLVGVDIRLNKATGLLAASFAALDPGTGRLPENPLQGFLPPNIFPPTGEGSISYHVRPHPLGTGTQIHNQASIVFDFNPPILTDTWTNTIDATPPVSFVSPLASVQVTPVFGVEWDGTDIGSGISRFSIFVSKNGGPFEPWIESTSETSGEFDGEDGAEYAFFSVAWDHVGNLEAMKTAAEARTTVAVANCAANAGARVRLTPSGFSFHAASGRFRQTIRVQNVDSAPIQGPVSIVFDGLSANAQVHQPTGVVACEEPKGNPYLNVPLGASGVLAPGQTVTLAVEFSNPSRQAIRYTPRVLTGEGER